VIREIRVPLVLTFLLTVVAGSSVDPVGCGFEPWPLSGHILIAF
jgi:hypothetical protein